MMRYSTSGGSLGRLMRRFDGTEETSCLRDTCAFTFSGTPVGRIVFQDFLRVRAVLALELGREELAKDGLNLGREDVPRLGVAPGAANRPQPGRLLAA